MADEIWNTGTAAPEAYNNEVAYIIAKARDGLKGYAEFLPKSHWSHEYTKPALEALDRSLTLLNTPADWFTFDAPLPNDMFVWAAPKGDGKWNLGLGYRTVSGGWADAYGGNTSRATRWTYLPAPPRE